MFDFRVFQRSRTYLPVKETLDFVFGRMKSVKEKVVGGIGRVIVVVSGVGVGIGVVTVYDMNEV